VPFNWGQTLLPIGTPRSQLVTKGLVSDVKQEGTEVPLALPAGNEGPNCGEGDVKTSFFGLSALRATGIQARRVRSS
jgi:hypothetical protein